MEGGQCHDGCLVPLEEELLSCSRHVCSACLGTRHDATTTVNTGFQNTQ